MPSSSDSQLIRQGGDLVTVVLPTHGSPYLVQALASVAQQSYRPIELLLVVNGGLDAAALLQGLEDVSPRVVRVDRALGAEQARALGVAHTTTELVAFLDHDDVWLPDKLARQVEVMRADPIADLEPAAVLRSATRSSPSSGSLRDPRHRASHGPWTGWVCSSPPSPSSAAGSCCDAVPTCGPGGSVTPTTSGRTSTCI